MNRDVCEHFSPVDQACDKCKAAAELRRLHVENEALMDKRWVGLTDEELKPLCDENHIIFGAYTVDFIQAIEAKLKEKNT